MNFGRVECWCGNSYGKYGQFPNDCNSKCSGNKNQLCGGGLRNSIYSLLSNATATAIGSTRGIACEGQTLNLQCPQEQKLTIASANFGRTDSTMCGLWSNTNCKSDQTAYFQKQCNNNKSIGKCSNCDKDVCGKCCGEYECLITCILCQQE